jgi:hypothetical protein
MHCMGWQQLMHACILYWYGWAAVMLWCTSIFAEIFVSWPAWFIMYCKFLMFWLILLADSLWSKGDPTIYSQHENDHCTVKLLGMLGLHVVICQCPHILCSNYKICFYLKYDYFSLAIFNHKSAKDWCLCRKIKLNLTQNVCPMYKSKRDFSGPPPLCQCRFVSIKHTGQKPINAQSWHCWQWTRTYIDCTVYRYVRTCVHQLHRVPVYVFR